MLVCVETAIPNSDNRSISPGRVLARDSSRFRLNVFNVSLAAPRMSQNYKDTLNLPKTDFPMKANLATREPEILEKVGGRRGSTSRSRRRATARNCSSCTTARRSRMAMSTWARR